MVTSCWLGTCLWIGPHPEAAYRFRLRWANEALCGFTARRPAHRQLVTTGWVSVMAYNHARFSDAERYASGAPNGRSEGRAKAIGRRLQALVRRGLGQQGMEWGHHASPTQVLLYSAPCASRRCCAACAIRSVCVNMWPAVVTASCAILACFSVFAMRWSPCTAWSIWAAALSIW